MRHLLILFIPAVVAISMLAAPFVFGEERQYDPQELEQGKQLHQEHCVTCHGVNGEGTGNWKERDEDGNLPPPPLNGTAHTWHHPVPVLYRIINEGTGQMGGKMPAWNDKLNEEQILLIINWITSLWPDDVYQIWRERMVAQ
ncbi:MAG: cytochrome c [Gammaproteobacteria bacterium]|nr:cytochrome c [Gammaproteobacteria bacterium]